MVSQSKHLDQNCGETHWKGTLNKHVNEHWCFLKTIPESLWGRLYISPFITSGVQLFPFRPTFDSRPGVEFFQQTSMITKGLPVPTLHWRLDFTLEWKSPVAIWEISDLGLSWQEKRMVSDLQWKAFKKFEGFSDTIPGSLPTVIQNNSDQRSSLKMRQNVGKQIRNNQKLRYVLFISDENLL